jgi:hypothetical protein
LKNFFYTFLHRRLNEATGVDQQYDSLLGFLDPQPAGLLQETIDHLAVNQVFRAAETDQVKCSIHWRGSFFKP